MGDVKPTRPRQTRLPESKRYHIFAGQVDSTELRFYSPSMSPSREIRTLICGMSMTLR